MLIKDLLNMVESYSAGDWQCADSLTSQKEKDSCQSACKALGTTPDKLFVIYMKYLPQSHPSRRFYGTGEVKKFNGVDVYFDDTGCAFVPKDDIEIFD